MKTMRQIEKNQLVGTGMGWAVFRDLFEDSNGKRVSVSTSQEFYVPNQKEPGKKLPSRAILFAKYALKERGTSAAR